MSEFVAELVAAGDLNAFRDHLDAFVDGDDEWMLHEVLWQVALTPGATAFLQAAAELVGVDDETHEDGDTLLMKVAELGDLAAVAALLDLGADPCVPNGGSRLPGRAGRTVLHVAKSAAMLELLLTRGARPVIDAQTTEMRWTALHVHARENRADGVRMLLQHGADPDVLSRERFRIDDAANFDARGVCEDPFVVTAPGQRAIDLTTSDDVRAAFATTTRTAPQP